VASQRKDLLVVGEVYHIFNKSIAGFRIFNNDSEFSRMTVAIRYYQIGKPDFKFSQFIKPTKAKDRHPAKTISLSGKEKIVQVIAYCFMPTHLHLILKQLKENGISTFMSNLLNSYARYFNIKHNRKGPLWEGRFKNVLVETDEQLLHLTRYIHLNPVTASLVNKPEKWPASSYREYISETSASGRICQYDDILDIKPADYKGFVEDRASYQRELALIKKLLFE